MKHYSDAPLPTLILRKNDPRACGGIKLLEKQLLVGSGKSGINLILGYLRKTGFLTNKNAQVLVPRWMGQWVYMAVMSQAFPVIQFNQEVRAIYVYHQFGFLQDLSYIESFAEDKGIQIIEDSAHLLKIEGTSNIIRFAESYALSSPPKFISMPPLGIIESPNEEFLDYVTLIQKEESKFKPYSVAVRQGYINLRSKISNSNLANLEEMNYKLYSSYLFTHKTTQIAKNSLQNLSSEFIGRQSRMQHVYSKFSQSRLPIISTEQQKVAVFKIPIFISDAEIDLLAARENWALRYLISFDRNQNLLKPDFKKAIAIPIHAQVSDIEFETAISRIAKVLN